MPLSKKKKKSAGRNQGAQWTGLRSQGNVKNVPNAGSTDKGGNPRPSKSSKHGRNKSIGRDSSGKKPNPGN